MAMSRFNVEKVKEVSETIKNLTAQFAEGKISASAIIEVATQKLDEVAVELELVDEPGALWPPEIQEFVTAVRAAGLGSERLERLYQNQLDYGIEAAEGLLAAAETDEEKTHWKATIQKLKESKS
jgi:hypothetical protein